MREWCSSRGAVAGWLIFLFGVAAVADGAPEVRLTRPVDVVFCLDTSGSMEQLLDSARARVWDIVTELGRLSPTPELHVGLLSYGNENAREGDGWVTVHSDLSDDLDTVYAELMSLTTGGGEELVGRVLHEAVESMNWSHDPEALKIIFIAGNETAEQDVESFHFRLAAERARERGIIINALYAGNREQGIVEKWPEVAREGQGNFSAIDVETGTMQIETPQDETLLALNRKLNATYLPYGERGADGLANQIAQDANASRLGVQSCSSRIVAKGSAMYSNASWDLVDAVGQGKLQLSTLIDPDLPEALRGMNEQEILEQIELRRGEREAIQLEIQQISEERELYVREVRARELRDAGLDDAVREMIREQALARGFNCEDC